MRETLPKRKRPCLQLDFADGTYLTVVEENVTLAATVGNDLHNLYLPAIVGLTGIERDDGLAEDDLDLIVYHGALRGELWEGDRVRLKPYIVNLTTPGCGSRRAMLIVDDNRIQKIG